MNLIIEITKEKVALLGIIINNNIDKNNNK